MPNLHHSQQLLSDLIHYTKYAKFLPELSRKETWIETVERNRQMHLDKFPSSLHGLIHKVYESVEAKRIMPSMRSMQFAGKAIEENNTRIYNCAYLPITSVTDFGEIMFLLLGGTGVGYSVQFHHIRQFPQRVQKKRNDEKRIFVIPDNIEGWAEAVRLTVLQYYETGYRLELDYSQIRPEGTRLKTAGGLAPGPKPLKTCIERINNIFKTKQDLRPIDFHDIVCHIADAVLAGGIRRSACISLFSPEDEEMLTCKSGEWWKTNPQRARANNSVYFVRDETTKEQFDYVFNKIKESGAGEPGIFWSNDKERNWGTNPCAEIALRPYQFCNTSTVNVGATKNQAMFLQQVDDATVLGTLQATYTNFPYLRPVWKQTTEEDALLGVSLCGIGEINTFHYYIDNFREAAEKAKNTNNLLSQIVGINPAARITTIKPEGTASLIFGTSSGIHPYHSPYYIRRIRFNKNEPISKYLIKALPELVEQDARDPHNIVLGIPVKAKGDSKSCEYADIPALEHFRMVVNTQREWIRPGHVRGINEHNVSCTITVDSKEWRKLKESMWSNRYMYAGISLLPYDGHTYEQAPFEEITEQQYKEMEKLVKDIDLTKVKEHMGKDHVVESLACAGGSCEIV